jgi:hypothetical protein
MHANFVTFLVQGNEVRQLVVQNPGLIIWRGTPHDITRKESRGAMRVLLTILQSRIWNLIL